MAPVPSPSGFSWVVSRIRLRRSRNSAKRFSMGTIPTSAVNINHKSQDFQASQVLLLAVQAAGGEGLELVHHLREQGALDGIGQEGALEAHDDEFLDLLQG